MLDALPPGVAVAFVRSANGTGGALSDADLARLARNADAEGLSSEAMDVSCCGNVYKRSRAGKLCDRRGGRERWATRPPSTVHRGDRRAAVTVDLALGDAPELGTILWRASDGV